MNKKLVLFGVIILLFCLTVSVFAEGDQPRVTIAADGSVVDVCYSTDGTKIAFAVNNIINIYGVDGKQIKRFGIKDGPAIDVMDYVNNTIATFTYTNPAQFYIWDETGANTKKLGAFAETADETKVNADIETAKTYRLLISPDGKSIVNVSKSENFGGVKLRDLATGKVTVFKGYDDDTSIYGCSFSADGSKFVTISRDERVKVWDPANGTLIKSIETGDPLSTSYEGRDVAVLSDGTIVVVKTDITLWSSDGKLIKTLEKAVDSSYTMVRASRDGNLFAVAFKESGLALYKKDGSLLKVLQTEGKYSLPTEVTGIAFSPDNKFMAVATDGGQMGKGDIRIFAL